MATYEGSNTHSTTSQSPLPSEVTECLRNARFLHLSTCNESIPHISLMNYTYLPAASRPSNLQLPAGPVIIMTTTPTSQKTSNLECNPRVSLLVHDWVSHRPPTLQSSGGEDRTTRGSLASLLLGLNTAALSSISCTINGSAVILPRGSEEEKWCKAQHLANNTFSQDTAPAPSGGEDSDGGTASYIQGDDVRVVVVKIKDGRVADWKGRVQDWSVPREEVLVNGIN